jgi:gas vesicle protein
MSNRKIIAGILTGIAAGAVIGLLFAPNKGYKTRRKITAKGNALADTLKDKFTEFVDNVEDKLSSVRRW